MHNSLHDSLKDSLTRHLSLPIIKLDSQKAGKDMDNWLFPR